MATTNTHHNSLPSVTNEEEAQIRDVFEYFVLSCGSKYSADVLHLPSKDSTQDNPLPFSSRCEDVRHLEESKKPGGDDIWKAKNIAIYPPGSKNICKRCADKWRESE